MIRLAKLCKDEITANEVKRRFNQGLALFVLAPDSSDTPAVHFKVDCENTIKDTRYNTQTYSLTGEGTVIAIACNLKDLSSSPYSPGDRYGAASLFRTF